MADKFDKLIEEAKEAKEEVTLEEENPITVDDTVDDIEDNKEPINPPEEVLPQLEKTNIIRKFAILLLDDPNGINEEAYKTLTVMLIESENEDLFEEVNIINGRAFINENYAEQELKAL